MTVAHAENPLTQFQWKPEPQAEAFIKSVVDDFLGRCPFARGLASRMSDETGTRFHDWIGHITLASTDPRVSQLADAGYEHISTEAGGKLKVFRQPDGVFPTAVVYEWDHTEIALKVESVADFLAANGLQASVEGEPLSDVRVVEVAREGGAMLSVIERHGSASFAQPGKAPQHAIKRLVHLESFRTRKRELNGDDEDGFAHAEKLIDAAIADVGRDLACDLWFAAEREFWMRRNRAAQVQYARQQRLGLGWANHDHHTYRCSREHFARLVGIWEKLGFVCRERFYAGAEAGWGAQVMEHAVTGIVTFNDVDLSPDELMADFAHDPLEPRKELGTVGLWCALHGESFLEAGMHHLECQFDFEALKRQLESEHAIKVMKPFSDFPHLRQAFTEGERWAVRPERIDRLQKAGGITNEQADKFRTEGAIGSHLENLERNAGFKGFNQKGVSEIIAATDPRKQLSA